jgi:hypothetical protein
MKIINELRQDFYDYEFYLLFNQTTREEECG